MAVVFEVALSYAYLGRIGVILKISPCGMELKHSLFGRLGPDYLEIILLCLLPPMRST